MYNHVDKDYECPFCSLLQGDIHDHVYSRLSDIVYRDDVVTAFIGSHQLKNNPGLVLVIPNDHIENIYDMSEELLGKVHGVAKRISIGIRSAYPHCKGNAIRQHNEPIEDARCKGQDVMHYHLQIIPRYSDDRMYEYAEEHERQLVPEKERENYAQLLRAALSIK
jgi:histidine triad (HIT) family protein